MIEITDKMLRAGVKEFALELPSVVDDMFEYFDNDESQVDDRISDVVTFIWQAMSAQIEKEKISG